MSIDDVIHQMETDELADRIQQTSKATPIEYGRLRGIAPQRVYYYLRNKTLTWEYCQCGRKVIDIEAADRLFKFQREEQEDATEGFDENN